MKQPPIITVRAKGGKKLFFSVWAAVLIFPFLAAGVLALLFSRNPTPSDSQLVDQFLKNRAAFEQLRDMLQEDIHLSRVAEWGIEMREPYYLGAPSEKTVALARYNKYLALLKEAGGSVATREAGEDANPSVVVWGSGWAGHTMHIGIAWKGRAPTNLVSTLDGPHRKRSEPRRMVYRHIDQNWYLWADW